jgi:hypothetical protein
MSLAGGIVLPGLALFQCQLLTLKDVHSRNQAHALQVLFAMVCCNRSCTVIAAVAAAALSPSHNACIWIFSASICGLAVHLTQPQLRASSPRELQA